MTHRQPTSAPQAGRLYAHTTKARTRHSALQAAYTRLHGQKVLPEVNAGKTKLNDIQPKHLLTKKTPRQRKP